MLNAGYRISGRYEIIRLIGEGGMANVYLAIDIFLKRNVAVKVLRGDLSQDEKFVMRFQREAISASSLSHPNIVELYDVGEDKGKFYIVMEYLEGKTLKQLIKDRKVLNVYEVIDIMKQLASALEHGHNKDVIHRDIKPHNIIISNDGKAKITDYGIAMITNSTMLTHTNSIMGSVHYLSPEQASGKGADGKSDIYSLGIVMYEMLTGEVPFNGENAVSVALEHLKSKIPRVSEKNKNVPQSVENVILKATAKSPKNRYKDSADMLDDLNTVLNDDRKNEPIYKDKKIEVDLAKTRIVEPKTEIISIKEKRKKITKKPEKKKHEKKGTVYVLTFILLALISLISLFIIIIPQITKFKEVVVPDVIGYDETKAEITLRNNGFYIDPNIRYINHELYKEGEVIETLPKAGTVKKEGSYITLIVSKGLEKIVIEDYKGKYIKDVQNDLESKGIIVEIHEEEGKPGHPVDRITKQYPEKGAKLVKGDTIQLWVTTDEPIYPDMVALRYYEDKARQFCQDHELDFRIKYEYSDTIEKGYVTRQTRDAGSRVIKGASIFVYISLGKDPESNEQNEQNEQNE